MHVDSPTRVTKTSATTIDYICSNLDIISCSVVDAGLSDHEAVGCVFRQGVSSGRNGKRYRGRIFSVANFHKFRNLCLVVNWQGIGRSPEPIFLFHNVVLDLFNTAFPLKWIKSSCKKKRLWYTKGLRISAANLRSLNHIKKFCDDAHFLLYCSKYRRIYRKLVQEAKKSYYNNRLVNAKNRQKECWRIVNNLRGVSVRNSCETRIDPNKLNHFYCTIAGNLAQHIKSCEDPLSYMNGFSVPSSFYFHATDLKEIKAALLGIKNKKANGDDGVSAEVLLNLPDAALAALVDGINDSWTRGVFPACLKSATVIPLYKGGDQQEPSNFRPISLLPTLSKVIEKIVKNRVTNYLSALEIIAINQFGFQESKGTHDAIFNFLESVYCSLNRGEAAAAVFCDLSKAFDCVDHGILLSKLERYGFRGPALKWFDTYLSGRSQSVVALGVRSASLGIECGVPQGSVLGPLLFLLYINDLVGINITGAFTIFADDTSVVWHNSNSDQLKVDMSADLLKIKRWCDSNRLLFNLEKTNIMGFKCDVKGLQLESSQLQESGTTKFLGVFIDNNLHFDDHILKLSKKLSAACFAIKITSRELGSEIARTAYFALFESHLRYGIPFWGVSTQTLLNILFTLQKRAVRFIVNVNQRESCRPLFREQSILTLSCLFIFETATLVYKNRHTIGNRPSQHSTRQALNLPLPLPNSALTKKSLIYEGRKLFNHLPVRIKTITSLKRFRSCLKKLLVDKVYYNLKEYYADSIV